MTTENTLPLIIVDDVKYTEAPAKFEGSCEGCAAQRDGALCSRLPTCTTDKLQIIFVKA